MVITFTATGTLGSCTIPDSMGPTSPGSPTTWLLCDEPSADGVLRALAQGRCAVAADPLGPVLLRVEGELGALNADGLPLSGPGRPLVPIRGERARRPADTGRYWLETHDGTIMALNS